jgi:hypothetical protein
MMGILEGLLVAAIVAVVGSHIGLCIVVARHSVHHESHEKRINAIFDKLERI